MRKSLILLVFALYFPASLLAQSRGSEGPANQLTIDSVTVSDQTITIHGKNFSITPTVWLPGGSGGQLALDTTASTDDLIVAFLPPRLKPGSYVLIVSKGRSTTDIFAVDVAIGVQGPAGERGADGAAGRDGKDGKDGAPGRDGAVGAVGLNCWDLNGDRLGNPSEDRNGDGVINALDCQGPMGPAGTNALVSAEGWSTKRTGLISFAGGTSPWTTVPGLSMTFTLQRSALVQLLANGSQRTISGTSHVAYRFVIDGAGTGDPNHGQLIQTGDASSGAWNQWTLSAFHKTERRRPYHSGSSQE